MTINVPKMKRDSVADEAGAVGDGPRELANTMKLEAKYSHTFSK